MSVGLPVLMNVLWSVEAVGVLQEKGGLGEKEGWKVKRKGGVCGGGGEVKKSALRHVTRRTSIFAMLLKAVKATYDTMMDRVMQNRKLAG